MLIVVCLICAFAAGFIGSSKGRSGIGYGLAGLLLGPIGVPNNNHPSETSALRAGIMRRCPECAESIRGEALVCRYCGNRDLDPVEASRPYTLFERLWWKPDRSGN
jgi:hypothetical protein